MGKARPAWGRWALVLSVLAVNFFASLHANPSLAAPPDDPTTASVPPAGGDPTVPYESPRTVQRGGRSVQARAIKQTRTADGRAAVADRIIVGFLPGVSDADKDAVHGAAAGRQPMKAAPLKTVGPRAQYVDVSGAPSLEAAIQEYLTDPRVAYAEPDYLISTAQTPNDPSFGTQYGMAKIHAPAAWNVTHGAPTVKIAVLDCGIYEAHPDLAGKVVDRQDFTGDVANSPTDPATNDRCNHGTHVAGIASADTNNNVGVAGVGYNTALMNGKVLLESYDSNGNLLGATGSTTWIANGILWAADHGANVINMSLGAEAACEQAFQDAIDYAWAKNIVLVAAAGNFGTSALFEPASCNHVVSVASTDSADAKSSFSNYGAWVHVAAPGSSIYSSVNPNIAENKGASYNIFDGTSMASPHVAGLAALLWATTYGTSAAAVVNRLETTADPIGGTGTYWQHGRINAQAAVAGGGLPPHAVSVTPATGSVLGGTTITLTGDTFLPGATVTIGGVAATVSTVTDGTIVAITAPHAPGSATIILTNPDGERQTLANAFTFTVVPAPRGGPAAPSPAPSTSPAARPVVISAPASGPAPAPLPIPRS